MKLQLLTRAHNLQTRFITVAHSFLGLPTQRLPMKESTSVESALKMAAFVHLLSALRAIFPIYNACCCNSLLLKEDWAALSKTEELEMRL